MKPEFLPAFICTICLVFLTACGSSKSVLTGDFTAHSEQFNGATVSLNYFSRTIDEYVVLGSSVVKNGTFEMSIPFDEDVPRSAYLRIRTADDSTEYFLNTIVEKDAKSTVQIVDSPVMWFRIESDGKYAHIRQVPLEDEIKVQKLRHELSELISAHSSENHQDNSPPFNEDDSPPDVTRERSEHAEVLDWDDMNCEDYAGEFDTFWERRTRYADQLETAEIREVQQRLDDLYEQLYTQRLQKILDTSSDPVERLLALENHFVFEINQSIQVLDELESVLPADVVRERITPRLERYRELQQLRQNDAALKLGTYIPTIEVTLVDENTVPLGSILQDNEIVVLDFWDNYCDICIKSFQRYRSFYTEYVDSGFEVVSLSIEGSQDNWAEKSKELDLPWINAFAPGGYEGNIRTLFGINYPRRNYVLDSEGCILKRDLSPDELLDFLSARLGQ